MKSLIYTVLFVSMQCLLLGQQEVYIHGTYDDIDWETLEFIGPHASVSEKIYYNYPESRTGKILLRKESSYRSKGLFYYTVRFPNISTIHYIVLNPSKKMVTMRDESGKYYKEFGIRGLHLETNELKEHPQQSLIRQVQSFIRGSDKYITNRECDKQLDYGGSLDAEGALQFSIYDKDMKFIFGDLNGDNILDAIMNANITQCDGGNGCCLCVEYVVALSQSSGKHTIMYFEFPETNVVTVQVPLRIEKNGSIFTKELYKINDDECRCCTSGERYKNYRFNGKLLRSE
jgi:hypothetical protein